MVTAAQWNIRDLPEADVVEQTVWGIRLGAEDFRLYYLVLSRNYLLQLKHGISPPQATCKV